MKLILDFDDVLFNAKGLKEVMFSYLQEEGVENPQELYEEERKTGKPFLPKSFLFEAINLYRKNDVKTTSDIVEELYNKICIQCPLFVNEELINSITQVGKENCYIVSSGDITWQTDKIRSTGLDALVNKAIVVPGSKSEEIRRLCETFPTEDVIFVDDKNIYFTDIDMEVCRNLKTVIYNENGIGNLQAEIDASLAEEQKRVLPQNIPAQMSGVRMK